MTLISKLFTTVFIATVIPSHASCYAIVFPGTPQRGRCYAKVDDAFKRYLEPAETIKVKGTNIVKTQDPDEPFEFEFKSKESEAYDCVGVKFELTALDVDLTYHNRLESGNFQKIIWREGIYICDAMLDDTFKKVGVYRRKDGRWSELECIQLGTTQFTQYHQNGNLNAYFKWVAERARSVSDQFWKTMTEDEDGDSFWRSAPFIENLVFLYPDAGNTDAKNSDDSSSESSMYRDNNTTNASFNQPGNVTHFHNIMQSGQNATPLDPVQTHVQRMNFEGVPITKYDKAKRYNKVQNIDPKIPNSDGRKHLGKPGHQRVKAIQERLQTHGEELQNLRHSSACRPETRQILQNNNPYGNCNSRVSSSYYAPQPAQRTPVNFYQTFTAPYTSKKNQYGRRRDSCATRKMPTQTPLDQKHYNWNEQNLKLQMISPPTYYNNYRFNGARPTHW